MSLHDRYSILLDKCVSSLTTWKNLINETLEGSDHETETARIKEMAKEYCIIDNNHKKSENAIKAVEDHLSDPSQTYDIDKLYNEKLEEQPDKDPSRNEIWRQLFCNDLSIQEVKQKKKKDGTQFEEVDDSLLCSTSFAPPVDPISKKVIRKPIRNKRCKHVYDKDSVYDYIRQSKKKGAKCPYMGCRNDKLMAQDLVEDERLEEQITQFLSTQQSQSSDEESDD